MSPTAQMSNRRTKSELGKRLAEIRKEIEADPNIKLLTLNEVRKEVESRRTGNNWEKR